MIEPIPFDPHRFRSAAAHYLQGRPAYAPALFGDVALLCGLNGTGRLLDLGCGPGQLATAFRSYVASAIGMDPEPEMLGIATRLASAAGVDIEFRQGSSQDLSPDLGTLRLVTIGRAFHWMDRVETARRLDTLLGPDGALVLFHTRHVDAPDNAWRVEFERVLDASLAGGRRSAWRGPGWVRHEGVLLDSPLSRLHTAGVTERRQTTPATLIDRALSMSSTSRDRLGDEGVTRLRSELTEMIDGVAVDGLVTEIIASEALIARRPLN
ncbi:class I SAM-dependent methyltransferase [Acidisphaera sp. L21]|uniref:class I SAM-dependent methyltransferase n=1 Tax=Acidisphaera sp. L21 TaxID=1641851 RepID=UPI00131BDD84|nr:class I SAM-dependent methyltransferase [Acidisphaera sp. L21]